MGWVEILIIALLIITVVDFYNNWRLGSKISGKSSEDINNDIQYAIARINNVAANQLSKERELERKLNVTISEMETKLADMYEIVNTILKTFDSRSSTAAKAMKVYILYEDAMHGGEAEVAKFKEYAEAIPSELKDLKAFATELEAKLESK